MNIVQLHLTRLAPCGVLLALCSAAGAAELPASTPDSLRTDLETINRYAAEVQKRSGDPSPARAAASPPGPALKPPPTQPKPGLATAARDPFAVSPRFLSKDKIRERRYYTFNPSGQASDLPEIKLKAIAHLGGGALAQIEVAGQGLYEVRQGQNVSLNGGSAVKVTHIGNGEVVLKAGSVDASTIVLR